MNKDNGGPAFPGTEENYKFGGDAGMSLRDYFAAKALSGMLADPTFEQGCEKASQIAYLFADAMLKERSK